jgi:outer membrane protein TolC
MPGQTVSVPLTGPVTVVPTVLLAAGQAKSDSTGPSSTPAPTLPRVPAAAGQGKPLPISLPAALALAGASPLDIQIANERLEAAAAALDRADVLWLPNISLGVDYFRHDGRIQDVAGTVFTTSRSSVLLGAGPNAVVPVTEAIYAPLVARQVVEARRADVQTARNDTTLQVAEAYFNVQQARGEVAGSIEALRRAEELVNLTQKVAPELAPSVEVNRARAEAARRRYAVESAYERWQVAAAELTRLLRLETGTLVEPAEEPALMVQLIDPNATPEQLIPIALTYRPELAANQAAIQAALTRVEQEAARPYLPTLAIRGVASQTPGLATGYFGGGVNDHLGNFGPRFSVDLQAVWEFQNLGLGNRALVREREAEGRQALLQLLRTQDQVSAEVVQGHARVKRAENRLKVAAQGVADAAETAEKNLRGLVPGKRVGEQLVLIFRPQEAVAAIAALDQAYRDYYAAVADHNRAQYQLYRALGHPAQCLAQSSQPVAMLPATAIPAPVPITGGAIVGPPPGTNTGAQIKKN